MYEFNIIQLTYHSCKSTSDNRGVSVSLLAAVAAAAAAAMAAAA